MVTKCSSGNLIDRIQKKIRDTSRLAILYFFKIILWEILSEICQVRLDFQVLNLAQPVAATGDCAGDDRDRILLDAGGNDPDRTLCGDLTGQHGILQFYT